MARADLLSWAEGRGIKWHMNGPRWGGRVEWYLSDPAKEPDMSTWKTELAFLTAETPNPEPRGSFTAEGY